MERGKKVMMWTSGLEESIFSREGGHQTKVPVFKGRYPG